MILLLLVLSLVESSGQFALTTVCGRNTSVGPDVVDGDCASATFSTPSGICIGPEAYFALVADYDGSRIRYVNLSSMSVTTIAGSSVTGYADGRGTLATFVKPYGIAINAKGSFALITDAIALTIRRLDLSSGIVTTLAGTAGSFGTSNGKGTIAEFSGPRGIALDAAGAVAVVADKHHGIRLVNVSTAVVTTLAGLLGYSGFTDGVGSSARFTTPMGIAMDANGSFAIVVSELRRTWCSVVLPATRDKTMQTDSRNYVVRRINVSTGAVTTLAGNASAGGSSIDGILESATFASPSDVALDRLGQTVLIVDQGSASIRRINLSTGLVDTIAGGPVAGYTDGVVSVAQLNLPMGCAIDPKGGLLVTDSGSNLVWAVTLVSPTSSLTPTLSASPTPSPTPSATSSASSAVPSVVVGMVTTVAGAALRVAYREGCGSAAQFYMPYGVAMSPENAFVLVADWNNHEIRQVNLTSSCVTTLAGTYTNPGNVDGLGTLASMARPYGIAIDHSGSFALFTDRGCHHVRSVSLPYGIVTTLAGSALDAPGYADGIASSASFDLPAGLEIGFLNSAAIVADQGNNMLRRIEISSGVVTTFAGNGSIGAADGQMSTATFNSPTGVAIDVAGSFVLVTDSKNNCIRRVTLSSGLVTTIAGVAGFLGVTDGVGSLATFYELGDIDIDSSGIAFIVRLKLKCPLNKILNGRLTPLSCLTTRVKTDASAGLVRRLDSSSGLVTTIAGNARGFGSIDGVGSRAVFMQPAGIAVDARGSLAIVAEHSGSTIRSVVLSVSSATQSMSMSALPTPSPSASFVARLQSQARITVTTLAGNITTPGYFDETGVAARFSQPRGVVLGPNASYLVVTDSSNACLRRVALPSGVTSTLAGTQRTGFADGTASAASFTSPFGLVANPTGTAALLVDAIGLVRHVNISSGTISTIAGTAARFISVDGRGASALFVQPIGIAADAALSMAVITDRTSLRRLDTSSGLVTTLAGVPFTFGFANGVGSNALFSLLRGVSMDASGTFVILCDSQNNLIRTVVISSASVSTLAGGYSGTRPGSADGLGSEGLFKDPEDVSLDPTATFAIVADNGNCRLRSVNVTTGMVTTLAGSTCGYADGDSTRVLFSGPYGIVMFPSGSAMIVADGNALRYVLIEQPSSTHTFSAVQQSASSSLSSSVTTTISPSPSSSASPYPLPLFIAPASSSALISDSLRPIPMQLWLGRCPSSSDLILLTTSLVVCTGESIFAAVSSTTTMDGAAATVAANLASPCAAGDTAVRLSAIAWTGVPFRSIATRTSLVCRVISTADQTLAATSVPLDIRPTLWPLWDDAIVVGANGIMRSIGYDTVLNASSMLQNMGACVGLDSQSCGWGVPSRVLAVGQVLWSNISMSPRAAARPFSLTVAGSSRILLRARWPAFSRDAASNASLGGVACTVGALSDDGAWVLIDTPSSTAICGRATRDCGYVSLSLSNAPTSTALGATLSCPPFCAGALDQGAVPLATASGSFTLGYEPATSVGLLPTFVAPLSTFTSTGIYFSASCSQTGLWPDSTLSVCQNGSDPASAACPFGGGDGCTQCPANAICPGGYRAWPRPNAWTASELQNPPAVYRCPLPLGRCLGWNITLGATQCGAPYLQGSFLCSACSPRYHLDDTGACKACPVLDSAWQRYSGLLYIGVAIIAIILVIYAFLTALVFFVGGTIIGGFARMSNLALWALMCAQVVSDAALASSPSLGPIIAQLYSSIVVLHFQGVLLPPNCTGSAPFISEISTMSIALGLWCLAISFYYFAQAPTARLIGRYLLMAAFILYPSATVSALNLLNCHSVTLPAAGAVNLDGGSTSYSEDLVRGGVVTLSVSVYDPYFVCWQGRHTVPAALAAVILPCFVIGAPLLSFAWLWRDPWVCLEAMKARYRAPKAENKATTARSSFMLSGTNPLARVRSPPASPLGSMGEHDNSLISASPDNMLGVFFKVYKPSAWYTKHSDLALLLFLSSFRALLPRPTDLPGVVGKTAAICTALAASCAHVLWVRPYLEADAWMGWVRALMLVDSFGITLLNAFALALDAGLGDSNSLKLSVDVGSIIVFALCVITLVVLLVGFGWFAFKAAEEEEAELVATRRYSTLSAARVAGTTNVRSSYSEAGRVPRASSSSPGILHNPAPPEVGIVDFQAIHVSPSNTRNSLVRGVSVRRQVDEGIATREGAVEERLGTSHGAIVASQSRPSHVGSMGMLSGKVTVRRANNRLAGRVGR